MERTSKENKYISWSAIFAGAIVGVGLNFTLNLFSLAIGISSFSVSLQGNTTFSIGGFLSFCLIGLIGMYSTGWVAARLTPQYLSHRCWGVLIGFLAWSVLLIITIILITNMIQYASFHANFTTSLVEVRLKNNSPMLTGTAWDMIKNPPIQINLETSKKIITLNAFLTFILFWVGALSSGLGGFIGYRKSPRVVSI